jgi:hypothetical protein
MMLKGRIVEKSIPQNPSGFGPIISDQAAGQVCRTKSRED